MILERIETVFHEGHNSATSMTRWKGKYWLCFRNGTEHRSPDGKTCVLNSEDLKNWSDPVFPIDTEEDNRDPTIYVWKGKLHVLSLTTKRAYADPDDPYSSKTTVEDFFTLHSETEDGKHWSRPERVWQPWGGIWWVEPAGDCLYAAGYLRSEETGRPVRAELLESTDGVAWKTVSIISDERHASETPIVFLDDGRCLAFVRHDAGTQLGGPQAVQEDIRPEIRISEPPYDNWETLIDFSFKTNGPCLGRVGDTVVASSRAMLEFSPPEIVKLAESGAVRGLLVMTVDVENSVIVPEMVLSCPQAPAGDYPDVSYADVEDLGEGKFVMSYYDGTKRSGTAIKLAFFSP